MIYYRKRYSSTEGSTFQIVCVWVLIQHSLSESFFYPRLCLRGAASSEKSTFKGEEVKWFVSEKSFSLANTVIITFTMITHTLEKMWIY